MAAFSSEWQGMGVGGKNLATDEEVMELDGGVAAKVIRLFMMQLRVDEAVYLKDAQGVVMEELGNLTPSSARNYRVQMQRVYGFLKSMKEEEGRSWLLTMTDRGVDFANWLIQDPDGQKWGVKTKVDLSAEEKRRFEEAFIMGDQMARGEAIDGGGIGGGLAQIKEGIVKWSLGKWGLLLDERVPRVVWSKLMMAVTKNGYRTVFVPDGYEVYVMEVVGEGGRGGKKAHRVTRWSDFPSVDRRLIMENEIVDGSEGEEDEQ